MTRLQYVQSLWPPVCSIASLSVERCHNFQRAWPRPNRQYWSICHLSAGPCKRSKDLMALEFTATLLEDQISFRCLLQSGWRRVPVFWAVFWIWPHQKQRATCASCAWHSEHPLQWILWGTLDLQRAQDMGKTVLLAEHLRLEKKICDWFYSQLLTGPISQPLAFPKTYLALPCALHYICSILFQISSRKNRPHQSWGHGERESWTFCAFCLFRCGLPSKSEVQS